MKALCWMGAGRLSIEDVPEPRIVNSHDAIVRVRATTTCGSDLRLLDGAEPTMRPGDVIGHEFMGEIVETGPAVRRRGVGERVVVAALIACGECWYCGRGEWSLCDNANPAPEAAQALFGHAGAAFYGHSPAFGGFPGSHAEYIRVPYADRGAFPVPVNVSDAQAVFVSDAAPTGWMAARQAGIGEGDVVAIWGCGGVGQMAAMAATTLGPDRVIVIDNVPDRLAMAALYAGATPINYDEEPVEAALDYLTGGRGPDVCIEASYSDTDQAAPLRQAIHACGKGGVVFVAGTFDGFVDTFPMGTIMNKALTLRSGRQHGQRYIPTLLDDLAERKLDTSYLATHTMPLTDGPHGYDLFQRRADGCQRVVFHP